MTLLQIIGVMALGGIWALIIAMVLEDKTKTMTGKDKLGAILVLLSFAVLGYLTGNLFF